MRKFRLSESKAMLASALQSGRTNGRWPEGKANFDRRSKTKLLLLLAVFTASTAWADSAFSGGSGTQADPYQIASTTDLNQLATDVNGGNDYSGKYFMLTADIAYTYTKAWNDASSTENNFVAIGGSDGTNNRCFRGDFDGAGHTISGIRIHRSGSAYTDDYQGIFGRTEGANIHGLRLADARITGSDYTGGIVGLNTGNGTVTDCHVASNVCIHAAQSYTDYHGGIIGYNGDIIGYNNYSTIANCTSAATLTIASGFYCYFYGAIAGYNNGTLSDNLAIGATVPAANNERYGAIAGYNYGTLQRNYYTACKVAGVENATGKGCQNADVTANDGAVSVHTITLGEGITITSPDEPTVSYGGTDYYKSGVEVTFSYTAPAGYRYDGFTASAGTLSGSTLTMPDEDVTISVVLAVIPWAGTGTKGDPYIIEYSTQLDLLAHRVNGTHGETLQSDGYSGKYFRLGADIAYTATTTWDDASSTENNYEAIGYYDGTNDCNFKGDFDGDDHTISGIRIHRSGSAYADQNQGIFGRTWGANIHGLRLADARITGYNRTGGIVGYTNRGSTVTDCHVANNVCIHAAQSNTEYHGGIAGRNYEVSTVERCTSAATLTIADGATGCQFYGAIAGYNFNTGTLRDNLAIGASIPAADNYYGAIVGYSSSYGTLQRNYYTACTVAGVANATNAGCANADVTANDGAVPGIILYDHSSWTDINSYILTTVGSSAVPRVALAGRTLQSGGWNTFCVPFNLETPTGWTVKTLTASEFNSSTGELTLTFADAASIEAGKPYLVKVTSTVENPTFEGVTISDGTTTTETASADFVPVMNPTNLTGGDKTVLFVTGGNKLTYPTADGNINAFRAYFQLKGDAVAEARAFRMSFDDDATGIVTVLTDEPTTASGIYTLDGRRLQGQPTGKGMYIVNGKKIVVK